jgi:GTPase SAR1 family protein
LSRSSSIDCSTSPYPSSSGHLTCFPPPQWIKEAKAAFQNRVDGLPIVILGLKRDLRSETDPNGVIYPQEGYQVAQAMRADRYVECSAETGELLGMAFHDICMTAAATRSGNGFGLDDQGCSVQ